MENNTEVWIQEEPVSPPPSKNSFFRKPIFLIVLLIILIVLGGGAVVLAAKSIQNPESLSPVTQTQAPYQATPTVPALDLKTSITMSLTPSDIGWKMYTDKQIGFSFLYPPFYTISKQPYTDSYNYQAYSSKDVVSNLVISESGNPGCSLIIVSNPSRTPLSQWVGNYKVENGQGDSAATNNSVKNTTIRTIPAKQMSVFKFDHTDTLIIFEKTPYVYLFQYENTEGNPNYDSEQQKSQQVCKEIIETLAFTN